MYKLHPLAANEISGQTGADDIAIEMVKILANDILKDLTFN